MPRPAPLALAVLLAVVSWHTATNLGGVACGVVYGVAVTAATTAGAPWAADGLRRAPAWVLPAVVVTCVVALTAVYLVGVPASYGDALGVGSDRADALDVALTRLAGGLYPYTATTYLGNPITPLPGALVLAAPFWWLTGHAAGQNVVWTFLLLAVMTGRGRPRPEPVVLWVLGVIGGLEVLREFLIGDDLVASVVPALAATAWTLRAARGRSGVHLAVAALALGVTTCTRPHLALVVVITTAAVAARAGARRAVLVGGCAALAWAALVVPFLVGGVARFSPVHVAAKVTGDRGLTAGAVVIALAALAAVVVALVVVRPVRAAAVGWLAAAVLFAPSLLSAVRAMVTTTGEGVDLTLGAGAVPFAVWAMACAARDGLPRPPVTAGRRDTRRRDTGRRDTRRRDTGRRDAGRREAGRPGAVERPPVAALPE